MGKDTGGKGRRVATTSEQLPTRPLSSRELTKALRGLTDVLSDPRQPRDSYEFADAFCCLKTLLTSDGVWDSIFEIQEGNKSNRILHDLGERRVEWLKVFYGKIERESE